MRLSWDTTSRCFLFLVCVSGGAGIWAQQETASWLPLSPEELAIKDSPANLGASAIILYRETDTDDEKGLETEYFRIKVFSEAGRKFADVNIPFVKNRLRVEEIQARTIHPDGKIIDFDGDIYEKTVAKTKAVSYLAKAFTLPDVQPGSIIEYKYKLRWVPISIDFLRSPWIHMLLSAVTSGVADEWIVQDELFTRRAHFSFRPIPRVAFMWTWSQLPATKRPERQEGIVKLDLENVPAFQEEDFAPPDYELKGRVDFFYVYKSASTQIDPKSTDWFWKEQGKGSYQYLDHAFIGTSKNLDRTVKEVTDPNDSPQEKLRKLYQDAQQIRNLSFESPKTEKERKNERVKENHNAAEVLKHGSGSATQINLAFVALARAAGFEAYIVEVPSRRTRFLHPEILDSRQLSGSVAEVRLEGHSLFLDPGNPYCPFDLLPWEYTGVRALRVEEEGGVFVDTPDLQSAAATIQRQTSVELASDGSLQGTMHAKFAGEEALRRRMDNREKDEVGRRKQLEDEAKQLLPPGSTVELTRMGDWETPAETLEADFNLKLQGLASSTGRRLLLPPAAFQTTQRNSFQAEKRVHPVYFQYPFQETDDLSIHLPNGYQVETLSNPHRIQMGPLEYEIECEVNSDALKIRRHLTIDKVFFGVGAYPSIRQFFQEVKAGDEEQVVLKRADTAQSK